MPLFKGNGRLRRDTLWLALPLAKPHFLGGRSTGVIRHGDFNSSSSTIPARWSFTTCATISVSNVTAPDARQGIELRRMFDAWRKQAGTDLTPMRSDRH